MLWLFQRGTTYRIVLGPGQYPPNTARYYAAPSGAREGKETDGHCGYSNPGDRHGGYSSLRKTPGTFTCCKERATAILCSASKGKG